MAYNAIPYKKSKITDESKLCSRAKKSPKIPQKKLCTYLREVFLIYYNIMKGGGPQYISILLRGSLGTPYLYYAVYGRPLSPK